VEVQPEGAAVTTPHRLDPLLAPRSVALVGASQKPGTQGNSMVRELRKGGFQGRVYAVNPNYRAIEGIPCFPSLADLPEPVDLVSLGVASHRLEEQFIAAAKLGAKAAVVFASCYVEDDPERRLLGRLAAIARDAGMHVCGGNGMGFYNLDAKANVGAFETPAWLVPGNIALITHSGTVYGEIVGIDRRLGYNLTVSAGQELVTSTAEYMDYALDQPTTRVIALFLEQVRDPERFVAALDKARDRDIPVVALKVGRSPAAAALARVHSNARVGTDAAYQAVFDRHGVVRVASTHEMAATLIAFAGPRRAGAGGLGAILDSGGVRGALLDQAAAEGVPIAPIGAATQARLAERLEFGLAPVNPIDAWGTGRDYEAVFTDCMVALAEDPATALVAFFGDIAWAADLTGGYPKLCLEAAKRTGKPVLAVNDMGRGGNDTAVAMTHAGVPLIDGTDMALKAIRHLFAYRDGRARPRPAPPGPLDGAEGARWRARLADGRPLEGAEARELLDGGAVAGPFAPIVLEAARDPDFGPLVTLRVAWPMAAERAVLAPCDAAEAARLIEGLGLGSGDRAPLAGAIARMARVAPLLEGAARLTVELHLGRDGGVTPASGSRP
jgi:acyl-CoA synthetase (NDP forming)